MKLSRMLVLMAIAMIAALAAGPLHAANNEYNPGPELDPEKDYYAVLITTHGKIVLELYPEKAPRAVQNFVNLAEGKAEFRDPRTGAKVRRPFYNGVLFHRVIPEFMIQTGDPTATGQGGPGYRFDDEIHDETTFNRPGLLAMANSGPNTNGSQFFITEAPATHLNGSYTLFGQILPGTEGLGVVKKIARVDRTPDDKPRQPVRLERVTIHRLDKDLEPADAFAQIQDKEEQLVAARR